MKVWQGVSVLLLSSLLQSVYAESATWPSYDHQQNNAELPVVLSPATAAMLDGAKAAVQAQSVVLEAEEVAARQAKENEDQDEKNEKAKASGGVLKRLFGRRNASTTPTGTDGAADLASAVVERDPIQQPVKAEETDAALKEATEKVSSDDAVTKEKKPSRGLLKKAAKIGAGVAVAGGIAAGLNQINRRRQRNVLLFKPTKHRVASDYRRAASRNAFLVDDPDALDDDHDNDDQETARTLPFALREKDRLANPLSDAHLLHGMSESQQAAEAGHNEALSPEAHAAATERRERRWSNARRMQYQVEREQESTLYAQWMVWFTELPASVQYKVLAGLVGTAGASADSAVDAWRMAEHTLLDPYRHEDRRFFDWQRDRRLLANLRRAIRGQKLRNYLSLVGDRARVSYDVMAQEAEATWHDTLATLDTLTNILLHPNVFAEVRVEHDEAITQQLAALDAELLREKERDNATGERGRRASTGRSSSPSLPSSLSTLSKDSVDDGSPVPDHRLAARARARAAAARRQSDANAMSPEVMMPRRVGDHLQPDTSNGSDYEFIN